MKERFIIVVALGTLLACSSGHEGAHVESLRSTASALTDPSLTPVPCFSNGSTFQNAWTGTISQLLFADALTECSAAAAKDSAEDGYYEINPGGDAYLTAVLNFMEMAESDAPAPMTPDAGPNVNIPGTFAKWYSLRSDSSRECDQTTLQPYAPPVALSSFIIPQYISCESPACELTTYEAGATTDLRTAELNYCVAQNMRNLVPGSAGGEALTFPASEERELLEVIRERSQIAMLQFALLGEVFANAAPPPSPPPQLFLSADDTAFLEAWALDSGNATELSNMANDFGAAVQLNVQVTQEVATLLARSRSARTPRGGTPPSAAADAWGAGSWHQRGMALMFGGDPLAIGSTGTWQALSIPQGGAIATPGTFTDIDWPGVQNAPYFSTVVGEPQVFELYKLAQQFNAVSLLADQATDAAWTNNNNPCLTFDVAESATAIYRAVEAGLEVAECYPTPAPGAPCPTTPALTQPYILQSKYDITPDHATTLAGMLSDALTRTSTTGSCSALDISDTLSGAMDLGGPPAGGGTVTIGSGTGPIRVVSAKLNDVQLVSRSLAELAPAYTRNAPLRFPEIADLSTTVDGGSQAFQDNCTFATCSPHNDAAEAKRTMGAMSALDATREMILNVGAETSANAGLNTNIVNTYYAQAPNILNVIGGAIGASATAIRPDVTPTRTTGGVYVYEVAGGNPHEIFPPVRWRAVATFPSGDPFWSGSTSNLEVCALPGLYSGNLAARPEVSINGTTLASALASSGRCAAFDHADSGSFFSSSGVGRYHFQPFNLGFELFGTNADSWTLVAVRRGAASTGAAATYRLLGGNVKIEDGDAQDAQYIATGGTLGDWITRQSGFNPLNPTEHIEDGFDLPTHWVPPFNGALIGGSATDSSAVEYLTLAANAAAQAATAAQTALDTLLQEQADAVSQQASAATQAQAFQQDQQALCGANNPSCNVSVSLTTTTLGALLQANPMLYPWNTANPDSNFVPCATSWMGAIEDTAACQALQHAFESAVAVLLTTPVQIAQPVIDHIADPVVPAFEDFSGGTLQTAFINQWNAIHAPAAQIASVIAQITATQQAGVVAADEIASASQQVKNACGYDQVAGAATSGFGSAAATGANAAVTETLAVEGSELAAGGAALGAAAGVGLVVAVIYTAITFEEQQKSCKQALVNFPISQDSEVLAMLNGFATLSGDLETFSSEEGQIVLSGAAIAQLSNQAQLANAQANLEAQLAVASLQTSFGLYRIYHDSDVWRAKALTENARIYALAARRAVEARYVVDLSQLTQPETFVAAPATWADEIYDYDLSLPSSLGLAFSSGATGSDTMPGPIYTNQIVDYVTNLQNFVQGYSASRPTAVATDDIDVLSLPGLAAGDADTVDGQTYYPEMGKWSLHCPADTANPTGSWIGVPIATGDPDSACGTASAPVQPDTALLTFSIDPWGQLNGVFTDVPFSARYNVRWTQLAVNFVGTGVKNCALAADPDACYTQEFIPYSLKHDGPAWITDYSEIWRFLDIPSGVIEGGKGLAAELFLDPLQDGWSNMYISSVARTEYELRPLGGYYTLEFSVAPEVVLDNIERIQLLIGSTYWVAQQ